MRSFPRTILYAVAGVLLIALISSALTMIIMNRTSGDRVVMSAEEYSEFSQIAALDDVLDSIEKEYDAEVPSREKMIAGAANGMLDTLDDPYARYYTAEGVRGVPCRHKRRVLRHRPAGRSAERDGFRGA